MYCTGRFYVDSQNYPMLRCNVSIPSKPTNKSGMVRNYAGAPKIHIALESTSATHLLHWINREQIKEHVQVRFINNFQLGADKVFDLYDVICVQNNEHFWGEGSQPMTNIITLIPAIMLYNGVGPVVQAWHIQDPKAIMKGTETKTTERPEVVKEEDFDITALYWTDMDGNKLEGPQLGNNLLVVHSEGGVGKVVTFNLKDVDYDFKYQGNELEDDQLKDYTIQADVDKLEIEAF